jgi:amino acid adenylation domain-containing protein/non-ribosomal peptide synthase protein (TIGR01720 family)
MSNSTENFDEIAIIGMAGRFPRARNVQEFWKNLAAGIECISFWSDQELLAAGVSRKLLENPNHIRGGGVLDDVEMFDAEFFKMSPKEAEITDPQQRFFLEVAWEALETAGYDVNRYPGRIGVYAGARMSSYMLNIYSHRDMVELVGPYRIQLGNDKDYIPTWTSYKLNLKGPSVAVQTACSSSLVATHMAVQSLINGECDMALAGGVSIVLPQIGGSIYREGGIVSPDGHCRAFDAQAAGTVRGNGVGLVVLKRLADALADRDSIRAVIKATAINNDGSMKVGYTAPSPEGQAEVISEAAALAGISSDTISYIEAHGTGTKLGDPIEVEGLKRAFRAGTSRRGFCALGSVKTNIGHLDTAAGIAGLIKTVLALENKQIPPTLHFHSPNHAISFSDSPFYVSSTISNWEVAQGPRRAGVSSFGIGGTNAHLVLEEAPPQTSSTPTDDPQLFVLSARTPEALHQAIGNLAKHLKENPQLSVADAAYTLALGRKAFEYRAAAVAGCHEQIVNALNRSVVAEKTMEPAQSRPVLFLFPGQGTQYPHMGAELYGQEPVFRGVVDQCSEILFPLIKTDLRKIIFPGPGNDKDAIHRTEFTQPALFVVEYALARLWMSWGVRPTKMAGHSIGEYVAACLAGVITLEEALSVVAMRGRLMQQAPAGAMLSAHLSETQIQGLLNDHLSIAAVNGPDLTVVSGPIPEIQKLEQMLSLQKIHHQRLVTSRAFHSSMMDSILGPFTEHLRQFKFKPASIPFVSNVTGTWITSNQIADPNYWATQLRQPVRFADALSKLLKESSVIVEAGAGRTLASLIRYNSAEDIQPLVLGSIPGPREEASARLLMIESLGKAWAAGVDVDWGAFYANSQRKRVPLPTYPFQRRRYWIDPVEGFLEDNQKSPASSLPLKTDKALAEDSSTLCEREAVSAVTTIEANIARSSGAPACLPVLIEIVKELTGVDPSAIDTHATFFDLGADSLILVQFVHAIKERLGIKVPYRLLFEDLSSLDALAHHLDAQAPPAAVAEKDSAPKNHAPVMVTSGFSQRISEATDTVPTKGTVPTIPAVQISRIEAAGGDSGLERLFSQQLLAISQVVTQQLETIRQSHNGTALHADASKISSASQSAVEPAIAANPSVPEIVKSFRKPDIATSAGLTSQQQNYLEGFIEGYSRRTRSSKAHTDAFRDVLAEPRASMGFRLLWKELVYPIVAQGSSGSRIWDIDGNEYIDIAMGFGVTMFGHAPAFIQQALNDQLKRGIQVGPESDQAGEVATLVCELTGAERVAFCNSGTEAVMNAMRLARTASGRSKIVLFAGSYHGSFDPTLAKASSPVPGVVSMPRSPGVPQSLVSDTIVLPYAEASSLEFIEANASHLAAVLVEPVQSRRPDVQPKEFLHKLREITTASNTALIFDEVVTGFRCHLGGAQAWFGVQADIVTYGKVVAGGMPIGIIAGKRRYVDAVDGGAWRFGDRSYPGVDQTFFAGTFCKHPLAMASTRAVLKHLKQCGPSLQEGLNRTTKTLVATLNQYFREEQVPLAVQSFGSQFYFLQTEAWPYVDLFFYHLVHHGIYMWEGRTCYISTAHTEADIQRIVQAIQQATAELRQGGFLAQHEKVGCLEPADQLAAVAPTSTATKPDGRHLAQQKAKPQAHESNEAHRVPVSDVQKQLWFLSQVHQETPAAFHESLTIRLTGCLNADALQAAFQSLIDRYEILRTTFSADGEWQIIHPQRKADLAFLDFRHLVRESREAEAAEFVKREVQQPFDLVAGPLIRARLLRVDEQLSLLVITSHHIITDGRSYGVLFKSLATLYSSACEGSAASIDIPMQFREFLEGRADWQDPDSIRDDEEYWAGRFADGFPSFELPADKPRSNEVSYASRRVRVPFSKALYAKLRALGAEHSCTMFMTLLAGYFVLLRHLCGKEDLAVGINVAQQVASGKADCIGYRINPLSIRCRLADTMGCSELLREVKAAVLDAHAHQNVPVNRLNKLLKVRPSTSKLLLIPAIFNLDQKGGENYFHELKAEITANHTGFSMLELALNVLEMPDQLLIECDYRKSLFEEETIVSWMKLYEEILETMTTGANQALSAMPPFRMNAGPAADPARSRERGFDLTQCQRIIWAGQKIHPETPMFLNAGYDVVSARVDRHHFEAAINILVSRCDALRTVIRDIDGIPRQVVLPKIAGGVDYVDLSHFEDPRAEFADWAFRRARIPFAMSERLFDIVLVKLADDEYGTFLNCHHVITDAWSVSVLIGYISEFYDLARAGRLNEAPDLPSFADCVKQEQVIADSSAYQRAKEYWRRKLTSELEPLRFYGEARDARGTKTQRVSCPLSRQATSDLREAAALLGSGPSGEGSAHQLFGALILIFLNRITGTREIGLGAPFHNRKNRERMVGLLMQILPLRVQVDLEDTVGTIASRLAVEQIANLRHRAFVVGNPANKPAYHVEYNYINARNPANFAGHPAKHHWVHPGEGADLLAIQIHVDDEDNYVCEFDFNCGAFDESTRGRIIRDFRQILDEFLCKKDRRVREFLKGAIESEDAVAANPEADVFIRLFEKQAQQTPSSVAVQFKDRRLTYEELNAAAEDMASHLRFHGIGPETLAALLANRSEQYLIVMLALYKAGAAYLPLDPRNPPARNRQILESSCAEFVIFEDNLAQNVLELGAVSHRPTLLSLRDIENGPASPLPSPYLLKPSLLSYVFYTSGSTGAPKGAMIEQRGMLNHLRAKIVDLGITKDDVVAQSAPQCFDVAVWQFLSPLLVGARVEILSDETVRDPAQLFSEAGRKGVTILEIVPSQLGAFLQLVDPAAAPALSGLRWLFIMGEVLPPEFCRYWQQLYPHAALVNAYGTTEVSDDVAHYKLSPQLDPDVVRVPVGSALPNTQFHILGSLMESVAKENEGELYIGGICVGRGYRNDPARTAEAFLPDEFSPLAGARLYKTGDRVKLLPDNNLDFIGRNDDQVKIRGQRVELSEIVSVLNRHSGVQQAVVTAREDQMNNQRLVAYIVPRTGASLSQTELRNFAQENLADYMVPASWVFLTDLPLTANGKVNKFALPAPDVERPELSEQFAGPRNSTEEKLARVWATVLGLKEVGINDNFFELGGDSIVTIQIAAKANQEGIRITPTQIFEHQTIAELATIAGTAKAIVADQGPISGPVPLQPIQQWFLEQQVHSYDQWNQSVMLELREPVDSEIIRAALEEILRQHDALRLQCIGENGTWRQNNLPPEAVSLSFSIVDLSCDDEALCQSRIREASTQANTGLSLAEGRLTRAVYFDRGSEKPSLLLLVVHHMAIDGVSWRILIEDLQTACMQRLQSRQVALPQKTTSYREWAIRLKDHAQTPEVERELDYWADAMPGSTVVRRDNPAGLNARSSAKTISFGFDVEETQALLKTFSQQYHFSVEELLLASLVQALEPLSNGNPLPINLESHGREALFEDCDLTRTVGWFTSLYPVTFDLRGVSNPFEAARFVRNTLEELPNRGINYGLLRYLSDNREVRRKISRLPAAEISFNYLGQFDQTFGHESLFRPVEHGAPWNPVQEGIRAHLLDVGAIMIGGQLQLEITYSQEIHYSSTIEQLLERMADNLRTFIRLVHAEVRRELPIPDLLSDLEFGEPKSDIAEIKQVLSV